MLHYCRTGKTKGYFHPSAHSKARRPPGTSAEQGDEAAWPCLQAAPCSAPPRPVVSSPTGPLTPALGHSEWPQGAAKTFIQCLCSRVPVCANTALYRRSWLQPPTYSKALSPAAVPAPAMPAANTGVLDLQITVREPGNNWRTLEAAAFPLHPKMKTLPPEMKTLPLASSDTAWSVTVQCTVTFTHPSQEQIVLKYLQYCNINRVETFKDSPNPIKSAACLWGKKVTLHENGVRDYLCCSAADKCIAVCIRPCIAYRWPHPKR